MTEPVDNALAMLKGKWKTQIIWHLIEGPRRYGDLRRCIPGVAERVLLRQLRELEADGLLVRTDYDTVPPHVDYRLSERARHLLPVLDALCKWGKLD